MTNTDLTTLLGATVDRCVMNFIDAIGEKYDISTKTLAEMWDQTSAGGPIPKVRKAINKLEDSESSSVSEIKIQKRRTKQKPQDDGTESSDESLQPVKRRKALDSSESESSPLAARRGKPASKRKPAESESESEMPKKRGKAKPAESESESEMPKKRGKAKPAESESESEMPKKSGKAKPAESESESEMPKKRGKPAPKRKPVGSESESDDTPAPKKRGKAKPAESESDSDDAPAPKKRGKPAPKKRGKAKPAESESESDDAPAPKKRGKPAPKKTQKKASNKRVYAESDEPKGGPDYPSPPDDVMFLKDTNFIIHDGKVVAGWGKRGIQPLGYVHKKSLDSAINDNIDYEVYDKDQLDEIFDAVAVNKRITKAAAKKKGKK